MINYSFPQKDKNTVFIVAEAGINHNGDFGIAARMVKKAAEVGVDAVKFQSFSTEDFIFDKSLKYTYRINNKYVTESMWDLCKRCEMKKDWLPKLKKLCDDYGIVFLSTPTSESGVEDLINVGVKILKNGSDYLSHLPLLKYMGSTNIPIIISTGMAYKSEVQDAIDAVRAGGKSPIFLLHCTSAYPTNSSDVNLRRMIALKKAFKLPVGFSDHTIASSAAIQSISLGACILEKHFTLSHSMNGPDHWFSLTPAELRRYVDDIRKAEKRMGSSKIEPANCEVVNRNSYRLSLIAKSDVIKGQILKSQDFIIAKPGLGLSPRDIKKVLGKRLIKSVKKGRPLKWQHFNNNVKSGGKRAEKVQFEK